jgi:hypothetical protein
LKKNAQNFLFIIAIGIVIIKSTISFSQNTFGSIQSNYSPTNGVILNPTNMINAKTYLDINIIGIGDYLNNNLVFSPDNNIINLSITNNYPSSINFDPRKRKIQFFNKAFVTGPGATWNKGNHAFGLAFNGRSYTGVQNIPSYAGTIINSEINKTQKHYGITYDANNIRISSVNFAEIQLSYAHTFLKKGKNMLIGGASVKKIYSIAGGAVNVNNAEFNVRNDSELSIFNLNSDMMYTPKAKLYKKGGLGLDLGFSYQKMLTECASYLPHTSKSGCRYIPYKYKLGLSIIDIGSVKFDPESINFAGYDFNNYDWQNYKKAQLNNDNFTDVFQTLDDDITSGSVKKINKIKLPTYISAQFDYNVWASAFYINATIIQGIPHSKYSFGIRHANSISITPRFETRLIDLAIPFSLWEYRYPQLGLSLRIGPITIGSDKFLNLVTNRDVYGGDIYFYAKVPIKYHPNCKDRIKNRLRNARFGKSRIDCSF